jgi:hypothetical protein
LGKGKGMGPTSFFGKGEGKGTKFGLKTKFWEREWDHEVTKEFFPRALRKNEKLYIYSLVYSMKKGKHLFF